MPFSRSQLSGSGAGSAAVEAARKGPLELRHVQFAYPLRKARPVFHDLNLTLPLGSVTALIGRRSSPFSFPGIPK